MKELSKPLIFLIFFLCQFTASSQPNCNLYQANESCYQACIESEKAMKYYSGNRHFQEHLLRAIELCPDFDFAYFELSVNYAKRGLMHEWIKIMDKAVELAPTKHLGWRGWYHWFFAHNYEKAIADIDRLDALLDYDIGTTGDGLYHLNILKGLCYKGLGDIEQAIHIIQSCMADEEYYQGANDYLHLGVLYMENNELEKALKAFEIQNDYGEIAEAYYYSSLVYSRLGQNEMAMINAQTALEKYEKSIAMSDPYRELPDEIFRTDILGLLSTLQPTEVK